MSSAVDCVEPLKLKGKDGDPVSLDSILQKLKSTPKGMLKYSEPHVDTSEAEICDTKYVGDLDRIIGDREFDKEISFFETPNQQETSVLFLEDDQVLNFEQPSFKSRISDYSPTATSPPLSSPSSPPAIIPEYDDSTTNDISSCEPLCNIVDFLAKMQIENDKSDAAIADRVKRYQDDYMAHVASIHASAVSELKRHEEQLRREEEESRLRIIEEQQQLLHVIEEEVNVMVANKALEAEKRMAEVLGQIENESKNRVRERREDLMSILKESYNQFSSALEQMGRDIKEHGEVELPPETDEKLNRTLQQGDDALKSDTAIDDLETTVQKLQEGMTVVNGIRSIITKTRKKDSSEPETPVQEQKEPAVKLYPQDSVESFESTSTEVEENINSLYHLNPTSSKILESAKRNFIKFEEIQRSVSNIAGHLATQDSDMRSKLSRVLIIVNQFSHDASSNRQKLHQLINLLTGSVCNAGGVQVRVGDPKGPAAMFVKEQLSMKLISLAHDKQVQNQAVYASLMLRLWEVDSILKHICLYRLFLLCPYLVPYVPERSEYSTDEDYFRALGFRYTDDGTVENLRSYLKRMSAIGQLYGRLVSVQVKLTTVSLGFGWGWLSKLLLVPAQSAVTCAVLQGFLSMAGNLYVKTYKLQFHKLMRHINEDFYPILESVNAEEGGGADLGSLRMLLDSYAKTGTIAPPTEGYRPLI